MSTNHSKKLIIVGGGGFSREVIWLARDCSSDWTLVGCLDDSDEMQGKTLCDVPVLGRIEDFTRFQDAYFSIAVGSPRTRLALLNKMNSIGVPKFATLVHPQVRKSGYVEIGEGSIVTTGCILTTQVSIGRHCILNLNVTVGHDCEIEDFCTIAPIVAVSGNVALGAGVEIGTGSSIRQGVKIGQGSMVGMGSVVTKDIPNNQLALGVPAKLTHELDPFLIGV